MMKMHPLSCLVQCSAQVTWQELEIFVNSHGHTVGYIADFQSGKQLSETLSAPAWLPPLWPAHTARGACDALSAQPHEGREYASVPAPKTASGPDLRSFFVGANGRFGCLQELWMRTELSGDVRWLQSDWKAAKSSALSLLTRFPGIATLRGVDGVPVLRIRVAGRWGSLCEAEAREQGWHEGAQTTGLPLSRGAVGVDKVVTVPWAAPDPPRSATFLAAGPTHLAWGFGASDTAAASRYASALTKAGAELVRWVDAPGSTRSFLPVSLADLGQGPGRARP